MSLLRSPGAGSNGFAPRAGFVPFNPEDAETTLAARFRETAARHVDAVAYVDDNTAVTYGSLLARASAIAAELTARCQGSGGKVAILPASRSRTLESILGTLLGGFAYFCADPDAPAAHVAGQLTAVSPVAILRDGTVCDTRRHAARPDDTAALYATSGTTGAPRLVALSHRAILFDIGRQTNDLYLGPDDRFDLLFRFAFSASLAPMFAALLNGAQVHLLDARHRLPDLARWLGEHRITVSNMTVSTLRTLCADGMPAVCPDLRLLSASGERLLASDVAAFRAVFPRRSVLQNAMAATETRTYAQYFMTADTPIEDPIPIGWPVAGKDVVLLDDGEIAVRSRYLASGYSNDAQRTKEKFIPQEDGTVLYRTGDRGRFRADGSLVFLGRRDSLVKIRGHRVELGAIEDALNRHPQIVHADVIVRDSASLVARYAARKGATIREEELRQFLGGRLPAYMIPASFVPLAEVPLNANGKLDRRRLCGAEVEIGAIWEEVLGRSGISGDDNFYDLGGDSLSAALAVLQIRRRLRRDVPADAVHRYPVLADLARFVEAAPVNSAVTRHLIPFETGGPGWPIFFIHSITGSAHSYARLASRLGAEHPCFGFSASDGEEPSVESMAADYVRELRTVAPPEEPVVVTGFSFGGTIACEMARQMHAAGQPALAIVIDMPAGRDPGEADRPWTRRATNILLNLPAWLIGEAARSEPKDLYLRTRGHLARLLRRSQTGPDACVYFGNRRLAARSQSLFEAMYRALMAHAPQPYGGKIVLLRTRVPTLFRDRDPHMGWQKLAAEVEVHAIPGSHRQCMDEVNLPELAAVMERVIQAAAHGHAGSDRLVESR